MTSHLSLPSPGRDSLSGPVPDAYPATPGNPTSSGNQTGVPSIPNGGSAAPNLPQSTAPTINGTAAVTPNNGLPMASPSMHPLPVLPTPPALASGTMAGSSAKTNKPPAMPVAHTPGPPTHLQHTGLPKLPADVATPGHQQQQQPQRTATATVHHPGTPITGTQGGDGSLPPRRPSVPNMLTTQPHVGVPQTPIATPGISTNTPASHQHNGLPTGVTTPGSAATQTPEALVTEIEFNLNIVRNRISALTTSTPASSAKDVCSDTVAMLLQVENQIEAFKALHPSIVAFLPTDDGNADGHGTSNHHTSSKTPSSHRLPESTCQRLAKAIDELSNLRGQLRRISLRVQLPAATPYSQQPQHPHPLHPQHSQPPHPHSTTQPSTRNDFNAAERDVRPSQASSRKAGGSHEVEQSHKVIDSLARTRSTMAQVLDQSAQAHTTLITSTETAQTVLNEAESARNALSTSSTLVKRHENKAKMEQRLIYAAFLFFLGTAAYIIFKRFAPVLRPVGWAASSLYSAGSAVADLATGTKDPEGVAILPLSTDKVLDDDSHAVPAQPLDENVPRVVTNTPDTATPNYPNSWETGEPKASPEQQLRQQQQPQQQQQQPQQQQRPHSQQHPYPQQHQQHPHQQHQQHPHQQNHYQQQHYQQQQQYLQQQLLLKQQQEEYARQMQHQAQQQQRQQQYQYYYPRDRNPGNVFYHHRTEL